MDLRIPAKEKLSVTGKDDPLRFYFQPLTGYFYRRRLVLTAGLLGDRVFGRMLEIGSGSGILLPFLSHRAQFLVASDIHPKMSTVSLSADNAKNIGYCRCDAKSLPFADGVFDCVVCVSVLEFVMPLEEATKEIRRVLKPQGIAVVGAPVSGAIMKLWYSLSGCSRQEVRRKSDHNRILKELRDKFTVEKVSVFPFFAHLGCALFFAARVRNDSPR